MANYSEYSGFSATGFTLGGFSILDVAGVAYWESPGSRVVLASGNFINSATDLVANVALRKQAVNARPQFVTRNGVPLIKTVNGGHYMLSDVNPAASGLKFPFIGTGVDFDFWLCMRDFAGSSPSTNPLFQVSITAAAGGNTSFYVNHNNGSSFNRMSCGMAGVFFMETANGGFPAGESILKVKIRRVGTQNQGYLYRRTYTVDGNGVRTLGPYVLIAQGTTTTAPKSAANYASERVQLGSPVLDCSFFEFGFRRRDMGQTTAQLDEDEVKIDNDLATRFFGISI